MIIRLIGIKYIMKKNYQTFIVFFLFLFLSVNITGCNKEIKQPYDNQTDIATLTEHKLSAGIKSLNVPYQIRQGMSVVWDIEKLKSDGLAQIIRFNKDKYYSVTRVKNGKYLFLLYEKNMEQYIVVDGFLVSTFADKAFFETITKRMRQDDIVENDPSAYVDEDLSIHRFKDNSILEIKYVLDDGVYIVSEFQYLENQLSVLDYLLPDDLEKVSNNSIY